MRFERWSNLLAAIGAVAVLTSQVACSSEDDGDAVDDPGGNDDDDDGTPVPTPSCLDDDDTDLCTGESICINDDCVAAFNRTYAIGLYVDVGPFDPDGAAWDAFDGSAPDPQGYVYVNGTLALMTEQAPDTTEVLFTATANAVLVPGAQVQGGAVDVDFGSQEDILGCIATIDAQTLRNRGFSCSASGSTVITVLIPR
jgi:hypothetical protein